MDQRQHMETSIMDGLPPVSKDKQWRWRLAPPDQQESTETKLADIHYHRTTAQGSQITTDSTQDGHRGKTSTLPKKENQGAAAHDFRIVGQVQWRSGTVALMVLGQFSDICGALMVLGQFSDICGPFVRKYQNTGQGPYGLRFRSKVKKRSPSINYWRSAAMNDLLQLEKWATCLDLTWYRQRVSSQTSALWPCLSPINRHCRQFIYKYIKENGKDRKINMYLIPFRHSNTFILK
jgi:hypothetical protein